MTQSQRDEHDPRGRLADAMAAMLIELAAQDGTVVEFAEARAYTRESLRVLDAAEARGGTSEPPPGCRVTKVLWLRCPSDWGGVIYAPGDPWPGDLINAGGQH